MSPDGPKIVSPEEKLLRLIRGKERSAGGTGASAAPASPSATGAKRGFDRGWRLPAWWLLGLNVVLAGVVVAELTVWLVTALKPEPQIPSATVLPSPAETVAPASSEVASSSPTTQTPQVPALASVVSRPIFDAAGAPGASRPADSAHAPSDTIKALAGRLTLIGIVAGDPAQAIIEDAQTKKTFFVSIGQSVIEGLMVENVQGNRVVLTLNGEKLELSL